MYYKQKLKPKPSQNEIDTLKNQLYYKVFDVEIINNQKYYIDNDWKMIWDNKTNIVGIVDGNNYVFF